jgi:2-polyprenyl-6-methoxyphenol hydroxylase-like FAD-dependent oxidoreductase
MSFEPVAQSKSRTAGTGAETQRVLISGAGFAGLTAAFWMNRLGYAVTVVECSKGLKMGGSPVDIKEGTVGIVERMGLLTRIQALSLKPKAIDFLDAGGRRLAKMPAPDAETPDRTPEYEVERDILLQMMFDEVKDNVEFLFDDSIARVDESADEVVVTFRSAQIQSFSLLFGCDGNHSAVRRMCFGEESVYSHFLQNYFSITIVDKLLIDKDTAQMYNVPGKVAMLNAYNNKTDIIFCFFSEQEIPYSYRDQEEQRAIILQRFKDEGWRTHELLDELSHCRNFYFDKMCQIRMPSWTKGRVALVGDAAYCASPAAGMGGSLAIVGATALADAFEKNPGNFEAAFQEYNESLRPFIKDVQAQAIEFGLEMFVPRTEDAIRRRNVRLSITDGLTAGDTPNP